MRSNIGRLVSVLVVATLAVLYFRLDNEFAQYREQAAQEKLRAQESAQEVREQMEQANHEADTRLTQQREQMAEQDSLIDELKSGNVRLRSNLATANTTLEQLTPAAGTGDGQQECGLSPDLIRFLDREARRADRNTQQLQAAQQVIRNYSGNYSGNYTGGTDGAGNP